MALSGKKITELNPISDVTNKTVLPTVYIDDTYTEATATKVTVQQLKSNILDGAVLQPNVVVDTTSTSIELNKILENTIYQYGTLSSLTINTFDTSYQDSYIYFKTSENGFNFSFSNAHWITLYEPSFKLNTDYIIHLKNGVCVLEQPENPILNITATSGNITLQTNTVNSCTISGNTTFVLPQTVNNNILNKIILQIKIIGTPTIDWGATHYLVDSFTLTPGTYDIVYEYDSLNNYWKVGLLYSTGGGTSTIELFETTESMQTVTDPFGNVGTANMPDLTNLPRKNGMFLVKITSEIQSIEFISYSWCSESYIQSLDAAVCVLSPMNSSGFGNYIAQISGGTTMWQETATMTLNNHKTYTYTNMTGNTLTITLPSNSWTCMVYKNGVRLLWGPDVNRNDNVLTFTTTLESTDTILVEFFGN